MNEVIVWGSLIIPIQLLMLMGSALIGYFALSYRLSKLNETFSHRAILDRLFQTFVVGLLIWKFSPLVFDMTFVLDNPMSLLYFSGGTKGLIIAGIYSVAALSYLTRKEKLPVLLFPDAILTVFLAGAGVYSLFLLVFSEGGLMNGFIALVTLFIYSLQVRGQRPLGHTEAISHLLSKRGNLITALILFGMVGWGIYDNVSKEAPSSSAIHTETNSEIGVRIGNTAADFTLTTLDGEQVNLSDYRGQRVLLNFWATWCPPCKAEMPHMEKFYQAYQGDGIVVLAVNLTHTEKSSAKVRSFVQDREITFPIALDSSGEVSEKYRVRAYPTSFIIDTSGVIRDIYQGAISYDTMKQAF